MLQFQTRICLVMSYRPCQTAQMKQELETYGPQTRAVPGRGPNLALKGLIQHRGISGAVVFCCPSLQQSPLLRSLLLYHVCTSLTAEGMGICSEGECSRWWCRWGQEMEEGQGVETCGCRTVWVASLGLHCQKATDPQARGSQIVSSGFIIYESTLVVNCV